MVQTLHAGVEDMRGRDEIRLANAQRHHIVHSGGDIEITPDAGWAQVLNASGKGSGSCDGSPPMFEAAFFISLNSCAVIAQLP